MASPAHNELTTNLAVFSPPMVNLQAVRISPEHFGCQNPNYSIHRSLTHKRISLAGVWKQVPNRIFFVCLVFHDNYLEDYTVSKSICFQSV